MVHICVKMELARTTKLWMVVDNTPRRYIETRYFNASKGYLFPIPQKERDLNPNLTQNPNW